MNLLQSIRQPRVLASLALCMAAALVGLVVGYDFGVRVGGTRWLGFMAALCAGCFSTLMADAVASRLLRRH